MSFNNEEEFKLILNGKQYLINICILNDQLSLVLTLLMQPKKQFSGFFSLNELRISSKIFHHTSSLFEAKEILKRTVIKKQLSINEDEHKARIIFDTGLGIDSIPFPIILFRDLNVNHLSMSQNFSERISTNQDKCTNLMNINHINSEKISKRLVNSFSQKILTKPSIGNNLNNKILNNNNVNIEISDNDDTIKESDFNKSSQNFRKNNNIIKKIIFNNRRNKRIYIKKGNENINKISYHKIDLDNKLGNNNHKDFITKNNNILYKIYRNMRNNNNINSSFYKNLQNSFVRNSRNRYNSPNQNHKIFNNNFGILNNNINLRRNDNYSLYNNSYSQQNIHFQNMNAHQNINNNFINQYCPQNNNFNIYNHNKNKPLYKLVLNNNINEFFNHYDSQNLKLNQNKYLKTCPNQNNNNYIQNNNNMIYKNDTYNFKENIPKDNPRNRNKIIVLKKIVNKQNEGLEKSKIMDENIEEENLIEKNYRFRNLNIKSKEKIPGNLEKFKECQNLGDYIPSGQKFVSYLKFPDTRSIISSNNVSSLSTSIASSSNRIPGIEKNIIKYPSELEEITLRIKRILNKKNIKFKKIYKATTDGDSSTIFHKKCDNIKNTLILIYTSCNKRFGGFTTQTWDGDNVNKIDNNSFIFSIDKMKVYDIKKDKNAIKCNPDQGPIFINQIKLLDNFFIQGGITSTKGINFMTEEDYELTGGAEKFGIKEIEIYYAI